MKKEDVHLYDWERILIGEAPWTFMLEVLIRTIIIYIFLIIAMRIMGKRMTAQLSIFELAIVVMLGAIISIPMQVPDYGLLVGIFILMIAVLLHRLINILSLRSFSFEKLTQGEPIILLKNGELQLTEMKRVALSRENLFANLRSNNVNHLGQVSRIYLEPTGNISIFRFKKIQPGLSILPDSDINLKGNSNISSNYYACISCGRVEQGNLLSNKKCINCGSKQWTEAIQ